MKKIFFIIRTPFVIIPTVLWTAVWPVLCFLSYCIFAPVSVLVVSIFRVIGTPFVFLYSAFTDDLEIYRSYLKKWSDQYIKIKANSKVSIAETYISIMDWLQNPKKRENTSAIIWVNILGVVVVASIYSETLRVIVGAVVTVIVALSSGPLFLDMVSYV